MSCIICTDVAYARKEWSGTKRRSCYSEIQIIYRTNTDGNESVLLLSKQTYTEGFQEPEFAIQVKSILFSRTMNVISKSSTDTWLPS